MAHPRRERSRREVCPTSAAWQRGAKPSRGKWRRSEFRSPASARRFSPAGGEGRRKYRNRAHHVDFDQLSLPALRALNDGHENASDRHQTAPGKVRCRCSRLEQKSPMVAHSARLTQRIRRRVRLLSLPPQHGENSGQGEVVDIVAGHVAVWTCDTPWDQPGK